MIDFEVHVIPDSFEKKGHSITGVCFLRLGGKAFPDQAWSDFVVVILGWWLRELGLAATVEEAELRLMDGPFLARLQPIGNDMALVELVEERTSREVIWDEGAISVGQAIEACLLASSRVLDVCNARGWSNSDVQELKELVGARRAV